MKRAGTPIGATLVFGDDSVTTYGTLDPNQSMLKLPVNAMTPGNTAFSWGEANGLDGDPQRGSGPNGERTLADIMRDVKGEPTPKSSPAAPVETLPETNGAIARQWPVPGNGKAAVKGATGPNGKTYSDGRYSLEGAYRTQNGKPHAHRGIDLPGTVGDPIRSAADGVVVVNSTQYKKVKVWAQKDGVFLLKDGKRYKVVVNTSTATGWGNYIVVRHADGYETLYAHLDSRSPVKVGTKVLRGQIIGTLGVSGNARTQGSHLHFEVRNGTNGVGRTNYNPTDWIKGRLPKR